MRSGSSLIINITKNKEITLVKTIRSINYNRKDFVFSLPEELAAKKKIRIDKTFCITASSKFEACFG